MLTIECLQKCEEALLEIEHAKIVLSDPYSPQHQWPITVIEDSRKILSSYNLEECEELPDAAEYPRLFKHIHSLKQKKRYEEEQRRIKESPEYKLNEKTKKLLALQNEERRLERLLAEVESSIKSSIFNLESDIEKLKVP